MAIKVKIEEVSFNDDSFNHLDITVYNEEHYISLTTNKDDKEPKALSLNVDDWNVIDKQIRNIFKSFKDN
jgi:hypothetical protein